MSHNNIVITSQRHILDVHTLDVHTLDVHILYVHIPDVHIPDVHILDVHILDVHTLRPSLFFTVLRKLAYVSLFRAPTITIPSLPLGLFSSIHTSNTCFNYPPPVAK